MTIYTYLKEKNWEIVSEKEVAAKQAEYFDCAELNISPLTRNFIQKNYPAGIYKHQKMAFSYFLKEADVCLSTATASGKTMVFHLCAFEQLIKNPKTKILAVYPIKALASEQEERWNNAFKEAGLPFSAGRIDGDVPTGERFKIFENNQVISVTPDIIHSWLLSPGVIRDKKIQKLVRNISLLILDETHTYSGVFGSNSAFLFRRLDHVVRELNGKFNVIAASATIKKPDCHLKKLTGRKFMIIGSKFDTAPKKAVKIIMLNPPVENDLMTSVPELMKYISQNTNERFITFVDSRKQTEYFASITGRIMDFSDGSSEEKKFVADENLEILPYRSGYERDDRQRIQQKLTEGRLKGVISTSALEMGLDIAHLTMGILLGIPNSLTSFYQRIGRVGRHQEGTIIIINNGTINTKKIFQEPDSLFEIPLSESALYLENKNIQYIHALCLARQGGEHDLVTGNRSDEFSSVVAFPENFIKLCNSERVGEIAAEFQSMKQNAGEEPNKFFPLRDVEPQYKVVLKKGGLHCEQLGSLSFSQVMREAYPGAVYYYMGNSYRVIRVSQMDKKIEVRSEKKYYTTPNIIPSALYPNLKDDQKTLKYGNLIVTKSIFQIRESIVGYQETRGSNVEKIAYPLEKCYPYTAFSRTVFTSGVIFNHPALNNKDVEAEQISAILFEAFLETIPFEKADVNFGSDRFRTDKSFHSKGDRFVAVYDQTYGSLGLTERLLRAEVLKAVFEQALRLAENENLFGNEIKPETLAAIIEMVADLRQEPEEISFAPKKEENEKDFEKVIMINSVGCNIGNNNQEFYVESVFCNRNGKLMYRGRTTEKPTKVNSVSLLVPVDNVVEIPGVSEIGKYYFETGEVISA